MHIFEAGHDGHEQVVFCRDRVTGLLAVIAIHSTVLGPALGGTRFHAYAGGEDEAVADVLRLSRSMTAKAACAGLDQGGGKAVILGDPVILRTPELILAYARCIDGLGGRYLTAEDVGTTQADMDLIRTVTPYVTGTSLDLGGSGDPSEATAHGVFHAMTTVANRLWDSPDLGGRHVAIAGVGKVGTFLAELLHAAGVRLTVADVSGAALAGAAERFGAAKVPVEEIAAVACDVFAPCALGGALSPSVIRALRCEAVVGSANNQLASPGCDVLLEERGILYVPDFVANAGGIINIAEERHPDGYDRDRALAAVARIATTTASVLDTASLEGITTAAAADALAARRVAAGASTHP